MNIREKLEARLALLSDEEGHPESVLHGLIKDLSVHFGEADDAEEDASKSKAKRASDAAKPK